MEYNKIVSVTGLPGLYELVSSKTDGAIVRSLDDKTTRFASGRIHNFSHLESIEVYTTGDNVNLVEIFHAMDKGGDSLPDTKDNAAIKKFFEKVYAEVDFERVYSSDLKKMIKWYEVLKKNNIEIKLSEPEPEPEEEIIPEKKPEPAKTAEKKEASKPATVKKAAKKKTEEKAAPSKSSTPAKKAAKKKGK